MDNFSCNEYLLKSKHSAGSIFKIFLAMAGYYYKLLNDEDLEIINKKMLISDNDYFLNLINKINKINFILFVNEHIKDYIGPLTITEKEFKNDFSYLYGGMLKFYPEEILRWFKKLSLDKRNYSEFVLKSLKRNDLGITYYGKSGTWDGSAWFCGVIKKNSHHVICVLNKYQKNEWKRAKEKTFQTFLRILNDYGR